MSAVFPIEDDPRYRIITASAGQTAFAVAFPFQSAGDVKAFQQVAGEWVEIDDAGYTVTGAGNPSGGTLTFTAGRTSGERILILGSAVLERLTSIVLNGRFSSRATDDELDRNRLIQQELKREIDRAVKASYGETAPTIDLSVPDGSVLIKNGLRLEAGPSSDQISAAQGYAEDAIAAAADAVVAANQALAAATAAAASAASIALPSPAGAGNAGKVLQSNGSAWILAALAMSQITGLVDALAAKLALAGGVLTGDLEIRKANANIRLSTASTDGIIDIKYTAAGLAFYYNGNGIFEIRQNGDLYFFAGSNLLSALLAAKASTAAVVGIGQTYQDVTGSRSSGTAVQNASGKPIICYITQTGQSNLVQQSNDGVTYYTIGRGAGNSGEINVTTAFVPNGGWIKATGFSAWGEVR